MADELLVNLLTVVGVVQGSDALGELTVDSGEGIDFLAVGAWLSVFQTDEMFYFCT